MTLSLYDTMSRAKRPFAPKDPSRVTLYVCGPTVYNYAHIGNFRTFLFEDLLRRVLEARGFKVSCAESAADAMKLADILPFDAAVIVDPSSPHAVAFQQLILFSTVRIMVIRLQLMNC